MDSHLFVAQAGMVVDTARYELLVTQVRGPARQWWFSIAMLKYQRVYRIICI